MEKTKIEFLKKWIEDQEKGLLIDEVQYRTFTSLTMARSDPPQDLLAAQRNAKAAVEARTVSIRQAKGILEELKNGKQV